MSSITLGMAQEMIRLDTQIKRLTRALATRDPLRQRNLARAHERVLYLTEVRGQIVNERSYIMQQEWARTASDQLQAYWDERARI